MRAAIMPASSRLWTAAVAALALSYGIAFDTPREAPRADTGRATFVAKGCARCHAVYGYGPEGRRPTGGPDLGERRVYGTRLELAADLWNHLPKMLDRMDREGIEPPTFTDHEVDAIVEYLSFIRYMDEPGNPRAGRRLLEGKKCTSCHRIGNEGGDVGPDLTAADTYIAPLDLATALWNHGPAMKEDFDSMSIDRPRFGRNDIRDMAAGIRSYITTSVVPAGAFQPGDPVQGRRLLDDRFCTRCHSIRGTGGDLAPEFESLDFRKTVTEIAGVMWNHGPGMWDIMLEENIPFPELTRREMADIIAFLYALDLEDPPGEVERGESLVEKKGCTSCHQVRGMGGSLASDLGELESLGSSSAMVAAMWSHAADMAEHSKEERIKWPSLSGREISDIFAFLQSLQKENG